MIEQSVEPNELLIAQEWRTEMDQGRAEGVHEPNEWIEKHYPQMRIKLFTRKTSPVRRTT